MNSDKDTLDDLADVLNTCIASLGINPVRIFLDEFFSEREDDEIDIEDDDIEELLNDKFEDNENDVTDEEIDGESSSLAFDDFEEVEPELDEDFYVDEGSEDDIPDIEDELGDDSRDGEILASSELEDELSSDYVSGDYSKHKENQELKEEFDDWDL